MTEWIKHDGGPQPVADDVWVDNDFDDDPEEQVTTAFLSQWVCWEPRQVYRILNQHLIDAARIEGIRLGLEAAAEKAEIGDICLLDPETIAKETAR
jgi:hypothetical protein